MSWVQVPHVTFLFIAYISEGCGDGKDEGRITYESSLIALGNKQQESLISYEVLEVL